MPSSPAALPAPPFSSPPPSSSSSRRTTPSAAATASASLRKGRLLSTLACRHCSERALLRVMLLVVAAGCVLLLPVLYFHKLGGIIGTGGRGFVPHHHHPAQLAQAADDRAAAAAPAVPAPRVWVESGGGRSGGRGGRGGRVASGDGGGGAGGAGGAAGEGAERRREEWVLAQATAAGTGEEAREVRGEEDVVEADVGVGGRRRVGGGWTWGDDDGGDGSDGGETTGTTTTTTPATPERGRETPGGGGGGGGAGQAAKGVTAAAAPGAAGAQPVLLPAGWYIVQQTSRRGIGNSVAEYNFGMHLALHYNLTRIHRDLRCARIPLSACADLFRLASLNDAGGGVSDEGLAAAEAAGLFSAEGRNRMIVVDVPALKRAKRSGGGGGGGGGGWREVVERELGRLRAESSAAAAGGGASGEGVERVVVKVVGAAASHGYADTWRFWSGAYRRARRLGVGAGGAGCPLVAAASGGGGEERLLHVALHVRRGDVLRYATRGAKGYSARLARLRFTADEWFVGVVRALVERAGVDRDRVVVHVVTDGSPDDVAALIDALAGVLAGSSGGGGGSGAGVTSGVPAAAAHRLAARDSAAAGLGRDSGGGGGGRIAVPKPAEGAPCLDGDDNEDANAVDADDDRDDDDDDDDDRKGFSGWSDEERAAYDALFGADGPIRSPKLLLARRGRGLSRRDPSAAAGTAATTTNKDRLAHHHHHHHPRVRFHGGAPTQSLHLLAAADVLVGSKSGFTQLAAVIGAGLGAAVKVVPDAEWPRYDGIPNVVKASERILDDSNNNGGGGGGEGGGGEAWATALGQRLRDALGVLVAEYKGEDQGAWTCEGRPPAVVRSAVESAVRAVV
ncbi:hypothetical protein DFJ73DRAFT_798478 [Zopfochytrium polystomum]|nr:hypothetical protein DFJ73DRAFT_798478 [Zopfochytrium polystomum]